MFWDKLFDFFLFCLIFFGQMAVTFLILWGIIVSGDWIEDKIRAWWKQRRTLIVKSRKYSRVTFGW